MEAAQKLTDLNGVVKLTGCGVDDLYRIRCGQFQLVWKWNKETQVITMLEAADRKDIYGVRKRGRFNSH